MDSVDTPDGTRLAVALQPDAAANPHGPTLLRIYSVATGAVLRTWTASDGLTAFTGPTMDLDPNNVLRWVDGGRELAFSSWWRTTPVLRQHREVLDHMTIRLLDTTRAGAGLIASSRLIWSAESVSAMGTADSTLKCAPDVSDALVTPDGTTVVCGAISVTGSAAGRQTWTVAWLEYSAATGKLVRTLPAGTVSGENMDFVETGLQVSLEWADASGQTLIGYWPAGATRNPNTDNFPIEQLGVFSTGAYKQLPPPLGSRAALVYGIAW